MHKAIPTFLSVFVLFLTSCSSVKSTQKAINSGNYDKAIGIAIKNLEKNKTKEKNQPYITMLQDAFKKATERDIARIDFLEKENQPQNLRTLYDLYRGLKNRQERIKPLLPLKVLSTGRNAEFKFEDYNDAIISVKEDYATHLYNQAKSTFDQARGNKMTYRLAYDQFKDVSSIYPNFKNINELMQECHDKGTDFVHVAVFNETDQLRPRRLEDVLLSIDTYGLNDFWTVYHSRKMRRVKYDFDLELNFRRILVSPEQIREKEVIREKEIIDGFKYLKDRNGNFVLDSLGKKKKVDNVVLVRCNFYRFTQFKRSNVEAVVKYIDNRNNQLIDQFPLASEFVFEHSYAEYDGDKRALNDSYLDLIRLEAVPFPSNEQMVFDTGTDIKQKLKRIIRRNKFRN